MARIDLARRAEIGRDKRAKTRAQLVMAARALYAVRAIDAVTVDDLVAEAQVAKGTFYVHFASLTELQAVVADELARELDELLQGRRLLTADPVLRVARGCEAFVAQAIAHPAWAALVSRGAGSLPGFAAAARTRLLEDLEEAAASHRLGAVPPELAAEFAFGIVLQAIRSASSGRLRAGDEPAITAGVLRAIGLAAAEAHAIAAGALTNNET